MTIGKTYRVPCVHTNKWLFGDIAGLRVPIIGPVHEDAEIIKFEHEHWHIDWRFVTRDAFDYHTRFRTAPFVGATVISVCNTTNKVSHHRLKCRREMPFLPGDNGRVNWLKELEGAYVVCRLKPGMICPHKGIPLEGCPVNDGVVVCPAHGLAWNVATGELVRRT